MAEILHHDKFKASVSEIEIVQSEPKTFEELPISEPQYGETHIGDLTDEETAQYVELFLLHQKFEKLGNTIGGGTFIALGQKLRTTGISDGEDITESLKQSVNSGEAYLWFEMQRQEQVIKSNLFWVIGERLKCHDYSVAIRSKRRIVRLQRKW